MPITIPHNRLDLWYNSTQTFFKIIFFNNQFWSFQAQFRTYLPCTSQWGKFSSSRLCIFDFRNEVYTKFQSRKHVLLYILAIFIFPPFWQSNTTRISNLVVPTLKLQCCSCEVTLLLPWSTHTATLLEYLHGYSKVALELLQRSSTVTSV